MDTISRIVSSKKSTSKLTDSGYPDDVMKEQLIEEKRQKFKWNIAIWCMSLRFLLDGLEYAIIIPTLYGFLQKMNADVKFLGIISASYAIGGFVAAPVFGKVSDMIGSGRLTIVAGCLLSVMGNLTYFFGQNQWHLVLARLFCGLSSGVEPVILGDIGRNEKIKESKRTSLFNMLFTIRQLGILFGPVFVILFNFVNIQIGSFQIDIFNVGSLFCACLFTACLLIFSSCYNIHDSAPPEDSISVAVDERKVNFSDENQSYTADYVNSLPPTVSRPQTLKVTTLKRVNSVDMTPIQETPLLIDQNKSVSRSLEDFAVIRPTFAEKFDRNTRIFEDGISKIPNALGSKYTLQHTAGSTIIAQLKSKDKMKPQQINLKTGGWGDLICEPILIGLYGTFAIYVQQSTVETVTAPCTDRLLDFGPQQNAFLLIGVGCELVIGFLSVRYLSKVYSDAEILHIGASIQASICLLIFFYAPYSAKMLWWLMPVCK